MVYTRNQVVHKRGIFATNTSFSCIIWFVMEKLMAAVGYTASYFATWDRSTFVMDVDLWAGGHRIFHHCVCKTHIIYFLIYYYTDRVCWLVATESFNLISWIHFGSGHAEQLWNKLKPQNRSQTRNTWPHRCFSLQPATTLKRIQSNQ